MYKATAIPLLSTTTAKPCVLFSGSLYIQCLDTDRVKPLTTTVTADQAYIRIIFKQSIISKHHTLHYHGVERITMPSECEYGTDTPTVYTYSKLATFRVLSSLAPSILFQRFSIQRHI